MLQHGTLSLLLHDGVKEASNLLVGPSFARGFRLWEFVQEHRNDCDVLAYLVES